MRAILPVYPRWGFESKLETRLNRAVSEWAVNINEVPVSTDYRENDTVPDLEEIQYLFTHMNILTHVCTHMHICTHEHTLILAYLCIHTCTHAPDIVEKYL